MTSPFTRKVVYEINFSELDDLINENFPAPKPFSYIDRKWSIKNDIYLLEYVHEWSNNPEDYSHGFTDDQVLEQYMQGDESNIEDTIAFLLGALQHKRILPKAAEEVLVEVMW